MTVRRRFGLGTERRPGAILVASNSGMAFAAARCLRLAGVDFYVVAVGRYWSARTMRGCLGSTVITPEQLAGDRGDDVVSLLRTLLARYPGSVVVPSGIEATLFLARNAAELPTGCVFPLSSEQVLLELNDKWHFAALLDRLGLPHPRTSLLSSVDEVDVVPFADPVVVKPLSAEGSLGVTVVRSADDLRSVVRRVADAGLLPVLAQEFIPGDDMAVSVVAERGEVRAHRVHQFLPDGLRFVDRPDAVMLAEAIVSATGAHGVLNIDLRRDARDDRLVVIECNPRLYATSHKSAYSGMNPVGLGIDLARGATLDVAPPLSPEHSSVDVISPLRAGAEMVRGRGSELSGPTRLALHAEVTNPVSSVVRAGEWRFPGMARRLRGERAVRWEAYAERDGV